MKTIYMSCIMALAMLAAATSCIKGDSEEKTCGPVDVRIVVNDSNGTRVGSDNTDNALHQLRVYAFNADGERVGYAEADNLKNQSFIPITLTEGGNIHFYVIANDKFGLSPQIGGQKVTDWSSLTQDQLKSVQFGGWGAIEGIFVSPMSNCRYDEFGAQFTDKYQNDYATSVNVKKPATGSLVIPVTVQHILGRLRLMLNKDASADDGVAITLTRAAVYHGPDAYFLYSGNTINYTNSEMRVDEFVPAESTIVLEKQTQSDQYTTVARTYLAPNIYGSSDPDTYKGQETDGSTITKGLNETYRLELTVRFDYGGGTTPVDKTYTVYLPQVPRNTSIDVKGTFKGNTSIAPTFNIMVNAWDEKNIDIPAFE